MNERRTDERVAAVRADKLIGEGSLSEVDECMSDAEVQIELDKVSITDPKAAVLHFIELQDLRYEMATNARWGNDDDPQLRTYNEWRERMVPHVNSMVDGLGDQLQVLAARLTTMVD